MRIPAGTSRTQPIRQLTTGGLTRAQRGQPRSSVNESEATSTPSSRAAAASSSGSMSPTISLARRNMAKIVCTDVAPREVEESFASLAMYGRAAQVHATVRNDGAHLHFPACAVGVASHQPDGVVADLDRDMNVVQHHAVGHELGARKIVSLDDYSHRVPFWRRAMKRRIGAMLNSGWVSPPSSRTGGSRRTRLGILHHTRMAELREHSEL